MKIIKRCKYRFFPDQLIAENIESTEAKDMCRELNEQYKNATFFFQVVADDFKAP